MEKVDRMVALALVIDWRTNSEAPKWNEEDSSGALREGVERSSMEVKALSRIQPASSVGCSFDEYTMTMPRKSRWSVHTGPQPGKISESLSRPSSDQKS